MSAAPARTVVYTDGACQGNPGPGGWAWAVPGGRYRSGAAARTTNQRMEINAALDAAVTLPGPLEVVSDSTYVVNCFRDRWWEGWRARGWVNSAKKPVANRDLWEPLIDAYRADPERIRFRWVKGHGADAMNDQVDRLAAAAAVSQRGEEGTGQPAKLGPPDRPGGPGRPSAADRPGGAAVPKAAGGGALPAPPGHLVALTGLRPPGLGGYDDNPIAARTRDSLAEILAAKATLAPDLAVLTGLALGAEQLGAEAAVLAGVPYDAVLAFPGQDELWPAPARERFAALVGTARQAITLDAERPATRQAAGAALARRDAWIARRATEALAVWDHEDAAVGRVVRSLRDHLGDEAVWIVEPGP